MLFKQLKAIIYAFFAIGLFSCSLVGQAACAQDFVPAPPLPVRAPSQVASEMPTIHATAGPVLNSFGNLADEYRLGPGDKLKVTVFGEDNLGGEVSVSSDGKVPMQLLKQGVPVMGMTVAQAEQAISEAYTQGYLKDPRVSVQVLTYRPFYILGEVSKPGEFPYNNGMTVVNAVALAQGFTYRADQKWVYIKHASSGKEEKLPLTSNVSVAPGDTVRIGERYF